MNKMCVTEEQLSRAIDRIVQRFNSQRIILFGSYARGTFDKRSDVDLLIITEFKKKRRTVQVEIDRILRGIGFARDIFLMTPEEFIRDKEIPGTIARPATQEGKVLYERL